MSKAIRIYENGGPEVLKWEDFDPGKPDAGEALVRHEAVGLNFIDVYHRTGLYPLPQLPATPGLEGAGIVEEIGEGVSEVAVGDRVAIDTKKASSNARLSFFRSLGWLSTSGRSDDLLMKTVVGIGGDEVTEEDGRLHVNGTPLSTNASRRERVVRRLSLPSVELPQRINEGEVWLSSDHEKGIDSRYFGPIARSLIACKVEALWTL